ncbi:NIPSNAP family protein [Swingsia samuiensis]|uniref:NIPSNAP family protein n=1 Tax=Swingsia samuiensis TaxID=1293412 RepID=A0A4Y6UNV2_9PROT|nr:NIPSNAP family protein [Swingsia samuiensis]
MQYAETICVDAKIGHVPHVVSALSDLENAGAWVTEVGQLNQLLLFYSSSNLLDLQRQRAALLAKIPQEFILQTDITTWRVIAPVLPMGVYGQAYEWRCYHVLPNEMEKVEREFLSALNRRVEVSPLMCGLISLEGTPRIAHLWPYGDVKDRQEKRAQAVAAGGWPPKVAPYLYKMKNALLSPLASSQWK